MSPSDQVRSDDLQQVMDQSPNMVSLWNADRTLRFANVAYAAAYGSTPAQIRGRHVSEILGDELYARIKPNFDAALAGEIVSFEHDVRLPDGSISWQQVDYVPDRRGDATSGVNVYIRDISRRKNAEKAAAHSAALYRNLYERAPAMMCSVDGSGQITSVSDLWAQKLGYTREEALGRTIFDFVGPDPGHAVVKADRLLFQTHDTVHDLGRQIFCKDGTVLDVLLSAILERDADGNRGSTLIVLQDVTAERRASQAVQDQRTFLDRVGRLAGVGGWSLDVKHSRLYWSQEVRRIHEVSPDHNPTLEEALAFYTGDSAGVIGDAVQQCISERKPYDIELTITTARGRVRWVRAAGEAEVRDDEVTRIFGAFQDITERKLIEREIAAQRERLRVTLDSIADAVITTDRHGIVQWLNPVASQLTGCDPALTPGQHVDSIYRVLYEDTRDPVPSPLQRTGAVGHRAGQGRQSILVTQGGREIPIDDSAAPIRDELGNIVGLVLVFRDVSEQRRLSQEIRHRASHDALTGLLNRSAFEGRLANLFQTAQHDARSHVLMYIDLDQFKIVNDTCGHSGGDRLLREISLLFREVVRSGDTLARLGGDEFGVLLQDCTTTQARRVAEQICQRMESYRFVHYDRRFGVGASIGVVPIDSRWASQSEVMQAADRACYAAKDGGRNRVHEWIETDTTGARRQGEMRWAGELPLALDEGRFELFAQHIVPCAIQSPLRHIELLLRLRDQSGRIITPASFLSAAERFNLITRVDRWASKQALQWMQQRDLSGVESIGINLSGQSIADRSFHEFVRELLVDVGFDKRKICFEIAEAAAITNIADAREFILMTRQLGARIALDDFGAGASSFAYLKNLPVDSLKIDGQFIRHVREDLLDRTAVCAFRDVARVCGLSVVAEGVESPEVLAELKNIGIDFAQGYLFHQPVPLGDLSL